MIACLCVLMLPGCGPEIEVEAPSQQDEIIVTELKDDSKNARLPGPGGGVLMQAFSWDVTSGETWWNTINSKFTAWDNAGISAIWLPRHRKLRTVHSVWVMQTIPFI